MTSASKEKIIRTQKSFNFGTKCMCNFLVVVLCWLPEKCELLSVSNDLEPLQNVNNIPPQNPAGATKKKDVITADGMTADDMLMYGIGAIPAFDDETGDRDGIATTQVHSSTSESSLAGLASIAGGFDHASLEPQYAYSPSGHTPAISYKGPSAHNISSSTHYPKNRFQQWISKRIKCGHFTLTEDRKRLYTIQVAEPCRFWAEGVASTVVAIFGLMGNLISIWVLSDDELRSSAFNRLLLALAIIDCMFILPGTIIYTAKAFSWQADWYNRSFPVFLYPFTEIALCSSIYMTIAIAVERYIGLCRPFQRLSGSCSAKIYITPVVLVAIALNIPKFFESETTYRTNKENNTTVTSIGVTSLRTHPDYITYYWMWTRLFITGVIPFILLALLNSKIYLAIRKSKHQLRALAIRSALPMAILGAKNAAGATAGVSSPDATLVPELAGISLSTSLLSPSDSGHMNNGHDAAKKTPTNDIVGSKDGSRSTTAAYKSSPSHQHFTKVSPSNNIIHIKNGQTSIVNGKNTSPIHQSSNCSPKSTGSPRPFIQRSMSALVTTSDKRNRQICQMASNGNGSNDLVNPLGRSYSTATTTVTHSKTNTTQTPPAAATALSNYSSSDNLAPILFGVVIVFVICNSLRVILNIYDSAVVDEIIECEKDNMGRYPPAWILCTISVSHLLLMANSSVNFLVYCVAGKRFRSILARKIRKKFRALRKILYCCCYGVAGRQHPSYFSPPGSQRQTMNSRHLNNISGKDIIVNGYKNKRHQLLMKHSSSPNTLLSLQNPQQFTHK